MKGKSIVLSGGQIEQKIERIAYQIYENTFNEKVVFLGGIAGNGYILAERIQKQLKKISNLDIQLFEINVNKEAPLSQEITLSIDDERLNQSSLILIDDVINSGRTMIYAVGRILQNEIHVLKIATLVNRTHRRYPVKADFVGLNIATTLQDSITVEFGTDEIAYLN
ncbi:phosphoribosyltransferase family protein [Crocinitomix catalasitica]|uniref:phosphoribosyltransferase family protein n=1 Tax=Crocinitomix catalasitica TaxID=184607 RepID=UPI00048823DA|nr:phosphoribosyltransferase family protein [Crocinitomix catalasitica]